MRQLTAFTKKEMMEQWRTGRLTILGIIFILLGIMSPALAKLTPWVMEMLSDSMAEQGMIITEVKVTALTSWEQFYKNVPTGILIFIIMLSGILTNEFQKGTLINMLTKGMGRFQVYIAKEIALVALWSVCYWGCFGITYLYTIYYWDNSIAKHVGLGAFFVYLAGILLISLLMFFSVLFSTSAAVLGALAGGICVCYLVSMIPKITKYLPTYLLSSGSLLSGATEPSDFTATMVISLLLAVLFTAAGLLAFNKKAV